MEAPEPDPSALDELGIRYGVEFKPESVFELCEKHGLEHPLLQAAQPGA